MIVKENLVSINSGETGKFQLRFPPVEQPMNKEFLLFVDNNGRPWECLKFSVVYE
jgi:hypothetical protein